MWQSRLCEQCTGADAILRCAKMSAYKGVDKKHALTSAEVQMKKGIGE